MAIVLALLSAISYGIGDFLGGVTSRAWDSRLVTAGTQGTGLLTSIVAVILFPGDGPQLAALGWGGLSGLGSAVGVLALYRGFARGSMSVVASVCGVVTTLTPALVGIAQGDRLSPLEAVGIVLTLPAVALVSRESGGGSVSPEGLMDGVLAGLGFGFLFVALDQAGSGHGAWPVLAGQAVSLVLIAPFAYRARRQVRAVERRILVWTVLAGVLSGMANLLYLAATGRGELAIVGVLSSLYPAATVVMARVWLGEHWNRLQITGMLAAIAAVTLVATA